MAEPRMASFPPPDSVVVERISSWMRRASCAGRTGLFFTPAGERPQARTRREARARAICDACPVIGPCREWARRHREYGFWGGESEEERAAAGFRVDMPVGRIARYPRGNGSHVAPLLDDGRRTAGAAR